MESNHPTQSEPSAATHTGDGHGAAVAPAVSPPPAASTHPPAVEPPASSAHGSPKKRLIRWAIAAAVLVVALWFLVPIIILAMTTVSTDDAYVDGHVTFVAPRVAGQVLRVLVDDNMRVKRGDVLVEIDPEPFQVQVEIKKAMVAVAQSDLAAATAKVKGQVAQARSARFVLEHAIESVNNQLATLRANVAQLKVEQSGLTLAESDYERNRPLVQGNAISRAEFDSYTARRDQAISRVESAAQVIQETRTSLGLPVNTENPLDVPPDLDQNFSLVRQALANLMETVANIGYTPPSWNLTPKQASQAFYNLDSGGDIDQIYAKLIPQAPAIKQAEAKLMQAQHDLSSAELDLRYCKILADIDGVVTRRNVNPGNFVQVGQSLMAVRSLTEIWVNANFKETQLGELRIGQRARLEVDMYGSRKEFEGRITGFTMGTGQTLSLLPPQNATGNFVKIVQRLPVRIELTDYDPEKDPLFVGVSVVPYVYFKEPAKGPHAGAVLQSLMTLPEAPVEAKP
jgi:membrane fusion protein (multidrug efflux system)